jgi:hypothetical protein
MKIAYFDCFSGISGDMVLGALIDAGLEPALLQEELAKLGRRDISVVFTDTSRHAIAATRAEVCIDNQAIAPLQEHHLDLSPRRRQRHDHAHYNLADVLNPIRQSQLDNAVKDRAIQVFERLAKAEAAVHGVPAEQVHLHEVGAIDAVVDVVGAIAGLQLLGVEQIYASPLRLGTGFVKCAHGRYPVPVPGVLELCRGIPCEQTDIRAELVTPTGAALITSLASFDPVPPMRQERVGYGAGKRDLAEGPNLLRLRIGETAAQLERDRLVLIEANIDDMNPEIYGYLFDLLLGQGAKDVYITPVYMKKGRPGNLLSVLVEADQVESTAATILAETTTIGVRYHTVERRKLKRRITQVTTPYGPVRLKVVDLEKDERAVPEYEDCAALARQHNVPLQTVYAAAHAATRED